MAGRPAPKKKYPKPKPARDPIAALSTIDPDLPPEFACVAIVSRTRKVFRQRRAS